MSSIKMLIRKVYLLAGVIMAANMFIVNEVRAMRNTKVISTVEKTSFMDFLHKASPSYIFRENAINLIGGLVSSCFNNYFKWWNYNPGRYCKLGCFGWRSGRFLNGIFQFDVNLNLGRGILWLIPGAYDFIHYCFKKNDHCSIILLYTASAIAYLVEKLTKYNYEKTALTVLCLVSLLQGFVSMPLAIHISKFSIAISLDSMLWELIGIFSNKWKIEKSKEEVIISGDEVGETNEEENRV